METPHQYAIHESVCEAIRDDVKALGGAKKVAEHFFPGKHVETAAGIVRGWSNTERAERPDPEQLFLLIELARAAVGTSEIARYQEQRLGCRIEWLQPEDERARLQQAFVDAVSRLETIRTRLQANDQRPPRQGRR